MRKGMQGPLARSKNSPPPQFVYQPPPDVGLDIVFHDEDVLVLNKPSGLLSVPGKSPEHHDSMETRAIAGFPEAKIVHRLDRGTSGVMIFALNAKAHRHLGLQFEKRQTEKEYVALVNGTIVESHGIISQPLRTDWYNRPKQMVDFVLGREAVTHWQILEREKDFTRALLQPKTGRSHQLRVHMQELGHPILGDHFYANEKETARYDRLMLHAQTLKLRHPKTGKQETFTVPCPF